jgi:hypothetical protein
MSFYLTKTEAACIFIHLITHDTFTATARWLHVIIIILVKYFWHARRRGGAQT